MKMSDISPKADIGEGVEIGFAVRVHPNARIGDGCTIGDFSIIGHPTRGRWSGKPVELGPNSLVRSHSVLYEGSRFANRLETGHHTVIREGTFAGANLRVGNFSDIEGDCTIGDFVRLHGYVHVGKGSQIGSFVWIFSLSTLMNDPLPPSHLSRPVEIEDGAVLGVGVLVLPGTRIHTGAFISAGARIAAEIPAGAIADGAGGRIAGHVSYLVDVESGMRHPWMSHFADAYPEEAQGRLVELERQIRLGRHSFLAQELE